MGIHVIYSRGEWKVKREGTPRALRVFRTRESAIDYGRKLGRNQRLNLYVHRMDGTLCKRYLRDSKQQASIAAL